MLADPMATGGRARRLAGSSYRGRLWPFPGALTPALLVALLCFSSAPAPVLAASFTVKADRNASDPDTNPKVLDTKGDTGKVEKDAVLKPARAAGTALTISHVVTLDIAGTVATTGDLQEAVRAINNNAEAGAKLILRATGTISTTGASAHAFFSKRADFTFDMQGGNITTTGRDAAAVHSAAANFKFTMAGGTISTRQENAHAVFSQGANFQFTMQDGTITTSGNNASAVYSSGEKFQFKMQGGRITTNGDNSAAISLLPKGDRDNSKPDKTFEHLLEIADGASVTAKGRSVGRDQRGAHAIFIDNDPGSARTRIAIAGTVTAEGEDAVAILINDADVTEFVISGDGKVQATKNATTAIKTANNAPLKLAMSGAGKVIGAITTGGGADSITLGGTASITGNITLGGGADSITLGGTASITGKIDMGAGADELTLNGGTITGTIRMGLGNDTLTFGGTASRVNGVFANGLSTSKKKAITVIDMGAGDDTVTLASLANIPFGLIDGGAHDVADTIDLSALVKRVRSSEKLNLDIAWQGFEIETGLVDDPPKAKEPEAKEPDAGKGNKQGQGGPAGNPQGTGPMEITKPGVTNIANVVSSNQRARAAVDAKPGTAGKHTLTLKSTGELKSTAASAPGLKISRKDFVFIMEGGKVTTTKASPGILVEETGTNFAFTMQDGTISTGGTRNAHAYHSKANNSVFTMRKGTLQTSGNETHAVYAEGEQFQFKMQGGTAKTSGVGAAVISLTPAGAVVAGSKKTYENLVEIGKDARVESSGNFANGIQINASADKSRTRVEIAGIVTVEGANATALNITNADVTVEISGDGKVEAKT